MNIFDCLTDDFRDEAKMKNVSVADASTWLECIFMFALTWSICATGDADSRNKMDAFVQELLQGEMSEQMRQMSGCQFATKAPIRPYSLPIPSDESIYKYRFVPAEGGGSWELWADDLKVSCFVFL